MERDIGKPINHQESEIRDTANIVLTGMRGSGKTTIGREIAKSMGREFIDLDDVLVSKNQMSIPDMVARYGWEYFRDRESEIVKEASLLHDVVIATGGGAVLRSENVASLQSSGILVYLKAEPDALTERIGNDPNRPPLTDKGTQLEELTELLNQRRDIYESAADIIIDTEQSDPKDLAVSIIKQLKDSYPPQIS